MHQRIKTHAARWLFCFALMLGLMIVISGPAMAETTVDSWEGLQNAINSSNEGDTIKLTGNVTAGSNQGPLTIGQDKNIVLDLNGNTLSRGRSASYQQTANGSVIEIIDGGQLTVDDSGSGGKITGGHTTGNGGGVSVHWGTFTLKGGSIENNKAVSDGSGYGGGVYVASIIGQVSSKHATFNMEGGTIKNNFATLAGGGVYVDSGTFNMTGGTIGSETTSSEANTAKQGGGVYVYGSSSSFAMSGDNTKIKHNKTNYSESSDGGGVYVGINGTFTMNSGTIQNNTSYVNGGGIFTTGTFTMSGNSEIKDNTAPNGGGVYIDSDNSSFTMNGGSIESNTASSDSQGKGGGVYVGNKGGFSMTAGTVQKNHALLGAGVYVVDSRSYGKFTMTGGTIQENTARSGSYSGVGLGGGVYVGTGGIFTMKNNMESVPADVTRGTIASNKAEYYGGGVYVKGGTFEMSDGSIQGNSLTNSQAGGNGGGVYVAENDGSNSSVFNMSGGNITEKNQAKNGAGVYVNGTFTMSGGVISKNFTLYGDGSGGNGAGVYVGSSGNFTMRNGTIMGNDANESGGGVYSAGTFNLNGGTVQTNTANKKGGGVFTTNTFTMSGGEIKNNTATEYGGGIYAGANITLEGSPVINNNTDSSNSTDDNIYLKSGSTIQASNLAASLDPKIGVTLENRTGDITTDASYESNEAAQAVFSSDDGYDVYTTSSKQAALKVHEESEKYYVYLDDGDNATASGGTRYQKSIANGSAMTPVTFTANKYYHFESFAEVTNEYGITTKWINRKTVEVSGTPTQSTTVYVPNAVANPTVTFKVENGYWDSDSTNTEKIVKPSNDTADGLKLAQSDIPTVGTNPAEGFKAEGTWSPSTPTVGTEITQETTYTYTYASKPTYSVTLNGGANAARSGDAVQNVTQGNQMTTVTYTANNNYHFPDTDNSYTIDAISENGINVILSDDKKTITVSGIPTADVTITIPDAVADSTPTPDPGEKAAQTITASDLTLTIGDTGAKVNAATSGNGTLSYQVTSGDAVSVDASTGDLTVLKEGTARISITASETPTYYSATKTITVTVNPADKPTPDKPAVTKVTPTSITVKVNPDEEASIDDGNTWVKPKDGETTITFDNLEPGKEYIILIRKIATDGEDPSPVTETLVAKTPAIGQITTQVIIGDGLPNLRVDGFDDTLAAKLCTAEDLKAVEAGQSILFTLTVNKQDNPPAEDKALCDQLAAEIGQSAAFSLDISVEKKVGDAEPQKVEHLNGNTITVSFDLPAQLTQVPENIVRTFYFIRVHHEKAEQLPTTVNNDRLSFQTDKFSTYALAYQDAESSNGTANQNQNTSGNSATNANNGKTGSGSSAKTGIDGNDHLSLALAIAGMVLVIGGAALAIRRKNGRQ